MNISETNFQAIQISKIWRKPREKKVSREQFFQWFFYSLYFLLPLIEWYANHSTPIKTKKQYDNLWYLVNSRANCLFLVCFSYKWDELCFLIVILFRMDIVNEMAHMHHCTPPPHSGYDQICWFCHFATTKALLLFLQRFALPCWQRMWIWKRKKPQREITISSNVSGEISNARTHYTA